MKEKLKKYLKEIVIFVLFLTVVTNALSYYRSMELNKEKLSIQQVKLLDDTEYTIDANKPILVHFWATWCPTCKLEASNIEKISKDYEVITFAVQSGSNMQIEAYMSEHNVSFKVVNDEEGIYARQFNIKAYPTTFIYDKDKNLKFSEVGYTTTLGLYGRMSLLK